MSPAEPLPVRIGVIGAGFMGRQHIGIIRTSPDTELVAVADPAVEDGAFGCPTHPDAARMLAAERVDAVIIANPNALHVDSAIECLEAGVAVLLEKPVAADFSDSRRLVAAVDRDGGRLLVGHHRRHHPAIARAGRALRDGTVGEVVAVSGLWAARKDDAYFTSTPWHRSRGAGVMLINLVHDLDLLRHLVGEVTEVQAMTSSHQRGLEVEDTVTVNLRFENGAVGGFLATDAAVSPWGWDQSTEDAPEFPFLPDSSAYQIVGTTGALSIPNLAVYSYPAGTSPDWHSPLARTYLPVAPDSAFRAQLDHFVQVARGMTDPLVSADDASSTLALVEAASLSARIGAAVDVAQYRAGRDR